MNIQVKHVNRLMLYVTAPFLGLILTLLLSTQMLDWQINSSPVTPDPTSIMDTTDGISEGLTDAKQLAESTTTTIQKTAILYDKTTKTMSTIVQTTREQSGRPGVIYNRRITTKLGTPIQTVQSDRIRMELYKMNTSTYKGYALKVKLKDPSAMSLTLGNDKFGGSETTLQAVNRYKAVAGINAGGFADGNGRRYPLGTTVIDGKYVNGFEASYKDLSFVGINKSGELIGGTFFSQQELDLLEPQFGATFVPILLKNGKKTIIPDKWKLTPFRAPRTVIGNYKDNQLLITVIDGYNERGSSGASLVELQSKLYLLGIVDAYNLDGGGSSSLILKGKVINNPSDGILRSVPTHFLFFE